jgi:hypothetical protein
MWVCFGLSRRQDHGKREQVSLSETRSRSESETLLSTIRRFVRLPALLFVNICDDAQA